ncbi:MAG TPA: ATP-dependent helicase HrpB, partial [Polyangiaceae bacterium]|nr:ATP-dependent helicase HrpB [Polyangiaceae bacterium]
MRALPIDPELPAIVRLLERDRRLVLGAPPGAGKTTRVPRALLDAGVSGEIVVLEPRRIAARLAASRVAVELGERVGETVGYAVRFEDVSSPRTRIRFVTEGILTRRLLDDPELRGVGAVLLDEFHERHLQGDLALALLRRLSLGARPDLTLCVMSATLDGDPVARYLGCQVIETQGRTYPVTTEFERAGDERPLELRVASAVRRSLGELPEGDVLVFLPGAREIRLCREACARLAEQLGADVVALHGDLSLEEQGRAVARGARRKVILSTNVAESSVTIEGVVAVVDSGLARAASHSPWTGLPTLRLAKISRASAKQREGRAGRLREGLCLRLYTRADHDARPASDAPEIERADLADTLLGLHAAAHHDLAWLDAPPAAAEESAARLLTRLGALRDGVITPLGRRMAALPLHPRLARLVVAGEDLGIVDDACGAAALLSERDIRADRPGLGPGQRGADEPTQASDVGLLLDKLHEVDDARSERGQRACRAAGLDPRAVSSVLAARRQLARRARARLAKERAPASSEAREAALGQALLAAFPDRFAKRHGAGSRRLALAGGVNATLDERSVVRDAPFLVALDADESRGVVVRLASAVDPLWLLDAADASGGELTESRVVTFNAELERVEAHSRLAFDGVPFDETLDRRPSGDDVSACLAEAAWSAGLGRFSRDGELERFMARARYAHAHGRPVRALDDAALRELLTRACDGLRTFAELDALNLTAWITSETEGAQSLESHAPSHLTLPSGRRVAVTYEEGKPPWVESYLQDFFGLARSPTACGEELVLHLLAPNRRAVQITRDLNGFWTKHY